MKARYIRISTPDQNKERQLAKSHPNEKLFIDVCSGSIPFAERTQAKELLDDDTINYITVHAVDRLGRNLLDILSTLEVFTQKGVNLKVENLGIESLIKGKPNPTFKLITSVLANVAEMERNNMLERQKEGIALAKAKGVYKGRERGSGMSDKEYINKYKGVAKRLEKGDNSMREIAKLEGVSLGVVQRVKKLYKFIIDHAY